MILNKYKSKFMKAWVNAPTSMYPKYFNYEIFGNRYRTNITPTRESIWSIIKNMRPSVPDSVFPGAQNKNFYFS